MANFRIIEAIFNCIDRGAVEVERADVNQFYEVAMRLGIPINGGAILFGDSGEIAGRVFYIDRMAN